MPEFLTQTLGDGPAIAPLTILLRALFALVLGGVVVFVYRKTRPPSEQTPSFPATLLLMTVLITMVTQVIGNNVARAFSLVGALSIVRFRTVVHDTLDTVYVIFAVAVGMAVGADQPWVCVIDLGVVALAAFLMRGTPLRRTGPLPPLLLKIRVGLGQDLTTIVEPILESHLAGRRLLSIATAKHGVSVDTMYEVQCRTDRPVNDLVAALCRVEGVQGVEVTTPGADDPSA